MEYPWYNAGFDGSSTADLVDRLDGDILNYHPDLLIVITGGNDMHFGSTPEEFVDRVRVFLDKTTSSVPLVVFCSTIPDLQFDKKDHFAPYVDALAKLFPYKNAQFIDLFHRYGKFDLKRFFTFHTSGIPEYGLQPGDLDPMHPNQLGNA